MEVILYVKSKHFIHGLTAQIPQLYLKYVRTIQIFQKDRNAYLVM